MTRYEAGQRVRVEIKHGVHYDATFEKEHTNWDGRPNGVARVKITDPGNSRRKPGDVVDVGTAALAPIDD